MSEVKVSVVIPTLNSAETLKRCLTSIRANRTKYKYEIIVADAGSSDKTQQIARKHADRVLNGAPARINRNKGVENAEGEIICFTDSDCIVPEDWIDKLVDGLLKLNSKDNKIVGVGGGSILLAENPSLVELAVTKALGSPLVSFKARNTAIYQDEREVLHNPPMNSAYLKRAVEEVGGFQEEYGYGGEDLELDAKLNSSGYQLYYLPQPLVHHMHKSNFKKFAEHMHKHGIARIKVGRKFKKYLQLHHYGPIFLCVMTFSPFFFIPLGMAVVNGAYVSIRERNLRLFPLLALLTVSFYVNYGRGEIAELRGKG